MDLEPRQHAPVIKPDGHSRRDFLGLSGAAGLATAALFAPGFARAASERPDAPTRSNPARRATNVIFMVSDGMSFGTLSLAEIVRRARDNRGTHWPDLWQRDGARRCVMRTASANSVVTDSAAAASAWGTGVHINNDAVNFTPDRKTPVPILIQAKQNGKATGLVTTTRVTHATPAGFIANCPSRILEDDIARQIAERGVDVVLGGGAKHFPDALRASIAGRTAIAATASAMRTAETTKPLLGLFAKSHTPYDTDRGAEDPSLADMARTALARLENAPNGFVLQIEGGRVDHAAHANDAGSLVHEQLAFDDALGVVLAWLEKRDDTLLIVTTDHGNANPGLTLYGPETYRCVERLGQTKHSFEWLFEQLATKLGYDDPVDTTKFKNEDRIPSLVEQATGITLQPDEVAAFTLALRGKQTALFRPMSSPACVLGQCLANHLGVAFISPNHTADFVELTAFGPGSELIPPFVDNIALHEVMIKSLDLAPAKAI